MARNRSKIFRYGRDSGSVLVKDRSQHSFKLETRGGDGAAGNRFTPHKRGQRARRIGFYMFAGGMRQHTFANSDNAESYRRRVVIGLLLGVAVLWLILRWVPC